VLCIKVCWGKFTFVHTHLYPILCVKLELVCHKNTSWPSFCVFTPYNVLFVRTFRRNYHQGYCKSRKGNAGPFCSMKAYRGSRGIDESLLISALEGGEWSSSCSGRFIRWERTPVPIKWETSLGLEPVRRFGDAKKSLAPAGIRIQARWTHNQEVHTSISRTFDASGDRIGLQSGQVNPRRRVLESRTCLLTTYPDHDGWAWRITASSHNSRTGCNATDECARAVCITLSFLHATSVTSLTAALRVSFVGPITFITRDLLRTELSRYNRTDCIF
jgi:hypothetical protein